MNDIEFKFRVLGKWPREKTPEEQRKSAPFNTPGRYVTDPNRAGQPDNKRYVQGSHMPVGRSYEQLEKELAHLEAESPVIIEVDMKASNFGKNGVPKADAPKPRFPGVIVSFKTAKHGPLKFVCDDCKRWQDNLRAIVLTMERLRLADLYGVTKSGEQYKGWRALPGPLVTPEASMTIEEAAALLVSVGGGEYDPGVVVQSVDNYRTAYREAVKAASPEAGDGTITDRWLKVQEAKQLLAAHHGVK